MTNHEVTTVANQLRERIAAILDPQQLAHYDAYQERLQAANAAHDTTPVRPTADEQAVLTIVSEDMEAAALQKKLRVLLRIETLPQ